MILIDSIAGKNDYSSIWCELHDDILGQRRDGFIDAFQIKTSKPETGYWLITDEDVKKSIKKFVSHEKQFPGKMGDFYFVSNKEYSKSKAKKSEGKLPEEITEAVRQAFKDGIPLDNVYDETLTNLTDYCATTNLELLEILRRTKFILGPERRSYEITISHTSLPLLSECSQLSASDLNLLRDALINMVSRASSLSTDSADQYWLCKETNINNSIFLNKKITVDDVLLIIQEKAFSPSIRFNALEESSRLKNPHSLTKLQKKFAYAGLLEHSPTMQQRSLAAESRLLELSSFLSEEKFTARVDQLVAVVEGVCNDARLFSETSSPPYRAKMLRAVLAELKEKSKFERDLVYRESYECLVGIAGLLTDECKIWWSEKFDLEAIK